MTKPGDVLAFWLDQVGPADWYKQDDALDAEICDRFLAAWQRGSEGAYGLWLTHPSGTLAYCILLDQFPRNMFRGQAKAFSTDAAALAASKMATRRDWDLRIDPPARQFFYLPMMHSENLSDQDHSVRLIADRMPAKSPNLLHAKAHREVIRRFGRFPYRNAALGRKSSQAESAFMEEGGYGRVLRSFQDPEK